MLHRRCIVVGLINCSSRTVAVSATLKEGDRQHVYPNELTPPPVMTGKMASGWHASNLGIVFCSGSLSLGHRLGFAVGQIDATIKVLHFTSAQASSSLETKFCTHNFIPRQLNFALYVVDRGQAQLDQDGAGTRDPSGVDLSLGRTCIHHVRSARSSQMVVTTRDGALGQRHPH